MRNFFLIIIAILFICKDVEAHVINCDILFEPENQTLEEFVLNRFIYFDNFSESVKHYSIKNEFDFHIGKLIGMKEAYKEVKEFIESHPNQSE